MPSRFDPDVNRLRTFLRGHSLADGLPALRRRVDAFPVAALVADDSGHYIAANAAAVELTGYDSTELASMSVGDLTPSPQSATGAGLWEEFISAGTQRGEYELRRKNGSTVQVRYWAYASIAPGIHLSLLVPATTKTH